MRTKKILLLLGVAMFNINAVLIGVVIWLPPIMLEGDWVDAAQSRSLFGLTFTKILVIGSILTMLNKGFHDDNPVADPT